MKHARLLPWSEPDGSPCRLEADEGSSLMLLADELEAAQLSMALTVLDSTKRYLRHEQVPAVELRYLANQLAIALSDVVRVAQSRGERLAVADDESPS